MFLVAQVTDEENILISALMHDSLEDVPDFTEAMLLEAFGDEVLDIVAHITEPYLAGEDASAQMQWLVRKEAYMKNVSEGNAKSAIISCADKLHNLTNFIRGYKEEGEEFLKHFHGSIKNQMHFYTQLIPILESKLGNDNAILVQLKATHKEALELFKEYE
jgi:(p)ppGpp synthase/HD superfamily hydrolase